MIETPQTSWKEIDAGLSNAWIIGYIDGQFKLQVVKLFGAHTHIITDHDMRVGGIHSKSNLQGFDKKTGMHAYVYHTRTRVLRCEHWNNKTSKIAI